MAVIVSRAFPLRPSRQLSAVCITRKQRVRDSANGGLVYVVLLCCAFCRGEPKCHPNPMTPDKILQVGLGFWASKTLLSAIEMELFTELAKHPEDLETLQGRLGLHPRSARDFFDARVALKFLERRDGKYFNTPATELFLDK